MRKAKRTPSAKKAARQLRKQLTDAESKLWHRIRRTQVDGLRFRRQSPIGPYVVDFVCIEHRLIIEVDGAQHSFQAAEDARRTAWLESQGYCVIRFWNNEVNDNIEGVLDTIIRAALKSPPPQPSPSEEGEEANASRPPKDVRNG